MRNIITISSLIITMTSFSQNNDLIFDHQALIVNDLKESGDFYLNILGFEEIPVLASQNPPKRWFKNINGKEIHLIHSNTLINELPKSIHMAFSPRNFNHFVAHLNKNNIPFSNWTGNINKIELRDDGKRQLWIQDPQGYWIEINDTNK